MARAPARSLAASISPARSGSSRAAPAWARACFAASSGGGLQAWAPRGYNQYTLRASTAVSRDSRLLVFDLPSDVPTLGAPLPSCLKVRQQLAYEGREPITLDKSYSPISLPDARGHFELLVKGYPPQPQRKDPGGLGSFLVGLRPGQRAEMLVKSPRLFHGAPYHPNRWADLGMVAGGTGIAPMLQMARAILADPAERTRLWIVFANRQEEDILMRSEMDLLARRHAGRLRIRYVLSQPPPVWAGGRGWVGMQDLGPPHLPEPAGGTMIMVCGRDEFLDTVCGRTVRAPPVPGEKKGPKVQGSLAGLLAASGYEAQHVYKF
mmetsp:Transcript_6265/g.17397  ORF Transcript_6265/g.17397 Transcript_6265/m.17397 type:complete len:322 (+) Transcript_6265:86-1051(+)